MSAITRHGLWGWINPDGTVQEFTFATDEAAINEMKARIGIPDMTLDGIYGLGFKLARVSVTVTTLMVLEPIKESGSVR